MIISLGGMAFSDGYILEALIQLLSERSDGRVITQEMISERAGVPLRTTQRGLKRLMRAGQIEGTFTLGIGYRYRVNNGSTGTTSQRGT